MDISAIIAFSNEKQQTLIECIRCLVPSCGTLACEIIVINNSAENIHAALAAFSGVTIVDNHGNVGIARARNQGASLATAEFIVFLDPDIFFRGNTAEEMHRYLEKNESIDVISPKVILPGGSIQYTFGNLPCIAYPIVEFFNLPFCRPRTIGSGFYDFIGFGGIMIRQRAWKRIGACDEYFRYGFEDSDWCKRAKKRNVRLFYYPDVSVDHRLHQSVRHTGGRQVEFYLSEIHYYTKHYGYLVGGLVWLLILGLSMLRLLVVYIRPRRGRTRSHLVRLLRGLVALP